ncbi:hypothetical protein KFV05_04340 [Macrococcoides canis]|uniref:hypothetical protein n=1 Tax=Macrococcoides canis TaxID=1855823 RepID=UPI0020B70787|nr:hypothetical protein [Macrococcus canis]UTH00859.1 hypothetical protein KFV04_04155 [Macrococcus canis]UTH03223.1 hypothetical protein KFV05_04340 [Macrococcus canis]
MNFLELIQKINKKKKVLEYKDTSEYFDVEKNKIILEGILDKYNITLDDLNNDKVTFLERSLFQYEAVKSFENKISLQKSIFYYFLKYPLVIYLLIFKKNKTFNVESDNILILHNNHQKNRENVLPLNFKNFEPFSLENFTLNINDILFLINIYKNINNKLYYSEFFIKVIYNIAKLSDVNANFNNKNILNSFEYSFCSSVCTQYLNVKNNVHINIMHGEKLYYVRDSFSKFNEFYVWGKYYKDLFLKLGMESSQFKVYTNPHFLELANISSENSKKNMTLYWTPAFSINDELILDLCKRFESYNLCVRYHPSYYNLFLGELEKISNSLKQKIVIEDPNKVTIKESLRATDIVIGTYSTVMMEGYIAGKKLFFIEDKIINKIKHYYPIYKVDFLERNNVKKYVFNIRGEE